ncbi:963_t:CDS:1, partial [Entrophospora sp. SA101]
GTYSHNFMGSKKKQIMRIKAKTIKLIKFKNIVGTVTQKFCPAVRLDISILY